MKTPQLLPTIPMERYGLNGFGKPLYRVVWSDSRTHLLGGDWNHDGGFEMRETELYEDRHCWILEKWQSAEDFAGPREVWDARERDSSTPSLGPYPSEGEYVFAYAFPMVPCDSMVSIMVRAIAASRALTPDERKRSIMDPLLNRMKRNHTRIDDIFDESQPAFRYSGTMLSMANCGSQKIHRTPSKRIKDMHFNLGAEDLRLPMSDNAFFTGEQQNGNIRSNAPRSE